MILKPKGCEDLLFQEANKWQYVNEVIRNLMNKYNYNYIRTPIFEASELFHRSVGEGSDIVSKETYDFKDRGERNITLRPEGTAGVVRSYIENKMQGESIQPIKLYYNGTMYRYERPQSGRNREFTQYGIEVIGSNEEVVDVEVISIGINLFKLLGLNDIVVKINTLGDKESRANYEKALREYFKPHLDKLCPDCNRRYETNVLRILDCKYDKDNEILVKAPKIKDYLSEEAKKRFEKVKKYLDLLEINYEEDENLVRGLDYYDHTVFEYEITTDKLGANNVLGGGGRYNSLVKVLGGEDTPACGMAIGLERLMTVFDGYQDDDNEVYVMAVSDNERDMALNLVQNLRLNGFKVDYDYLNKSLKHQFKQADRLNSKYLIILNEEDLKENQVNIKNNKTKEEEKIMLDYIVYYLDEKLEAIEGEIYESE